MTSAKTVLAQIEAKTREMIAEAPRTGMDFDAIYWKMCGMLQTLIFLGMNATKAAELRVNLMRLIEAEIPNPAKYTAGRGKKE